MSDLNENQTNEQVQTAEVSQSNSAESASARRIKRRSPAPSL